MGTYRYQNSVLQFAETLYEPRLLYSILIISIHSGMTCTPAVYLSSCSGLSALNWKLVLVSSNCVLDFYR